MHRDYLHQSFNPLPQVCPECGKGFRTKEEKKNIRIFVEDFNYRCKNS